MSVVAAVATARAQTTTVAPPREPTATLSGIVRDISGTPLADVNVMLVGEALTTRTDSAGAFTLRDAAPGAHTVLFRRIGYRSVEYRWPARAGVEVQTAVTMAPVPRALDRVVVEAPGVSRRRGTSSIAGAVVDSSGHPVSGADVHLIGAGLSTQTDSLGRFEFRLLAAGSYVVRVRRLGSRPSNAFMQIVDDDNRGINVKVFDISKRSARNLEAESGYDIADAGFDAFDRRIRSGMSGTILGPADLVRANRASLDQLLQQYRVPSSTRAMRSLGGPIGRGSSLDDSDCLLIDGRRPAYQPLRSYTSVDVQLIEVYRPTAFVDEYIVSQMDAIAECRGSMDRHPSYFVLWTRSVR